MPLNSKTPAWRRVLMFFRVWWGTKSWRHTRAFCYALYHPDNDDKPWLVKDEEGWYML